MSVERHRVAVRVFWWALTAYALAMTAATLSPIRQAWDELFGPNEAQLIVVTAAPIRNLKVTYNGQAIKQRPGWPTRDVVGYAAFPRMRAGVFEPVLTVSWEGPSGTRLISQNMRQVDSGRLCLYVLNLGASGVPIEPERPDTLSPFWWTCYSH